MLENEAASQGFWRETGRMDASGRSSSDLAHALELVLGTPVLDETGLSGRYDLHLDRDDAAPDGLRQALRDATGLTLVPDRRAIEILVVEHSWHP